MTCNTLLHELSETKAWAILPDALATLRARAVAAGHGDTPALAVSPRPAPRSGAVAVLPITGPISPKPSSWQMIFGGTDLQSASAMLREALADPQVGSIVLNIDSPGGSVYGVREFADEVYAARGRKPVVAVANNLAASAAYWIASAADEIAVTPSGEVGSIGVIALHEDDSAMLERLGVDITLITAGTYKGEGNPFEPLTSEGRDFIQKRVDEYYAEFVAAVARGRDVTPAAVRGGMGEGRVVGAREAVRLGMADRIATLEQAIARLAGRSTGTAARAEATTISLTVGSDASVTHVTTGTAPEPDPFVATRQRLDRSRLTRPIARG